MTIESASRSAAMERYFSARMRAVREQWFARLRGKSPDLLPFEVVAHVLQSYEHNQLTELRMIPLDKIVGSVGRYKDFTSSFMPRGGIKADRWARVDLAMSSPEGVPPIEAYQIGDVYFVADGNHRVSVARASGYDEIEAYVTCLPGDPGLEPGDTLDQVIIKAECANFLAQTRLASECDDLDIYFTRPGGYPRLLEHIYVHRYFMDEKRPPEQHATFPEAARDWYDNVYTPIIAAIRQHRLLRHFPTRTASDLYVWVSARILELSEEQGETVSPDEAARLLAEETHTPFYQTVLNLIGRLAQQRDAEQRPDEIPY
jgi:hypothetical protein